MDFNCKRKQECLKKFCAYCCTYKRDLLKNNNFVKTIEILPRVIVYKKLEKCATYHQELTVRNMGTLPRRINCVTEPNTDVSFKINGNTNLISGAYVSIDIYVEPTKKKCINHNRFFYIVAEHPDIVWEIPILVIGEPPAIFVPELVCLHKVPANTISNYQFTIYNPLESQISFSICSNYEGMTTEPTSSNIVAKDYCNVLIKCKVPNEIQTASLMVTLNNGNIYRISVEMELTDQIIYLSTKVVEFHDTYMGLKDQKNIHICNKGVENASFQWTCSESIGDMKSEEKEDEELVISEFLKIRNKRGCIPGLNSALSIVTFSPSADTEYNEDEEPPFKLNVTLYLHCPILGSQSYRLQINANIFGPDIEISPTEVDLGSIYMGEIQCFTFLATNKGPIHGKIYLKEYTDQKEIRCSLTPQSMNLKPNGSGLFQLTFYRRDIGKFLTKIIFKIKCGSSLPVLLRGISLAAKVKIWPKVFELGNIPICIPQKRFAWVANPLPVPVVVQPIVVDDGVEDPIILCVDYSKLPLHARSSKNYDFHRTKQSIGECDKEEYPAYIPFTLDRKSIPVNEISSQLSCMFQDKVLDGIPAMAQELLKNFNYLPQYQPEPTMKIIDAALDCILERSDYFEDLKEKQNYLIMDWEVLPSNAKEVAMEEERFYLKSNESKSFPVILIPNSAGPGTKVIHFKACPMGIENSDLKTAIRSKHMVSAMHLDYKCMIPAIMCEDTVKFPNPLYVDMEQHFHMKFKNIDMVTGFVYFKLIPNTINGRIQIDESKRKFVIAPEEEVIVPGSVIFRQVGTITLQGKFQMTGKTMEHPFSVEANVLPAKIQLNPEKLFNKQQVLELTRTSILIENICPTIATFSVSLKKEKYQCLEPLGGSLAPNQKILISIYSRYLDPGIYKNFVYVHVKHCEKLSIPVTFIVEGTPIMFEPNLKLGFDCGNVFKNNGNQNHLIKMTNFGEKSYRLLFLKQKPKINSTIPVFTIQQNGISLAANSEGTMEITVDTSREVSVEEEYSVDGMGEDNNRFKFFTFTAKCTVIKTKAVWSKNDIYFNLEDQDDSNGKMSDIVSLTNTTPMAVSGSLNVIGHFIISDEQSGLMTKSLNFNLEKKTGKQFTVSIDREEIDEFDICQSFHGSVNCKINNKKQKPLLLHAKIVSPGLKICTSQVTFFSPNAESYAHINIHNCSSIKAKFSWRRKTFRLTKNIFPKNYEQLSSNTISQIILDSPEEAGLKMPSFIKPPPAEVCAFEEEFFDEDVPKKGKLSVLQMLSLKHNIPNAIESKKRQSIISEPKPSCKPFLYENVKTQQIDIKQIFQYLGFAPPKCLEPKIPTTPEYELDRGIRKYEGKDEFEQNSSVSFQQTSGYVLPKNMLTAYMFLPPIVEGDTLVSQFHLEVFNGRTETLDVTVTSLKGRIQISKTSIDLGRGLWYKTVQDKIKLTNLCPYAVKVNLIKSEGTSDVEKQLVNGYIEFVSPTLFLMMPGTTANVEWKALLGLQYNFIEDIGVEINNATGIPIHFHGAGLMPMIIPKNFNQMPRKEQDTVTSYLAIRKAFENVQADSQQKASSSHHDELASLESKHVIPGVDGGPGTETGVHHKRRPKRQPANEFILLNYAEEIDPTALEIECMIGSWKFLAQLNESEQLRTKFRKFYCNCVSLRAMEFYSVINLKLTICRPIPWELPTFILNMEEICSNETKTFHLDIVFTGPGKVFLSVRTRTAIPGLTAWFEDFQTVGRPSSFAFFIQSPDEKTLRRYKNMNERDSSYDNFGTQKPVRLAHYHSYDFDNRGTHKRQKTSGEVKMTKEHYTKLSQPLKETKDPLILAEICQTTDENWANSTFRLTLLFTAMHEFYGHQQLIEDYLLIDTHLGPTLPILLQGQVKSRKSEQDE